MKNVIYTSILVFLIALTSFSQINIDLSTDVKMQTESIDPSLDPVIIIKNRLPGIIHNYSVTINEKHEEIPPFEIPSGLKASDCTESEFTTDFLEANKNLLEAVDESSIPDLLKQLKMEIKGLNNTQNVCKEIGETTISKCEIKLPLKFLLKYNQTIDVKITRVSPDTTISWTYTYKTPTKTPWKIMYGFTFVPNLMNPINTYYSQSDTSNSFFTIEKHNNQQNDFFKNISPTLMFQWAPMKKYNFKSQFWNAILSNSFYQIGFTGGISLNFASENSLADVNVMAGPSIIIADNISISAGIVLTPKDVLKGQYKESQQIAEHLDFSQLHDKKYMAEWFITLAIRFNGNPFEKKESTE